MVEKKSWDEFRQTGLALFINSILHVFGYAIVFDIDEESGLVKDCYPARVKFRGFDDQSVSESHKNISNYLADNITELQEEANS
jgi:hypothetical protein